MKPTIWIFALLFTFSASTASSQTATRADFDEWCEMFEGRVVGELPLPVEFPGIGKQGQKLSVRAAHRTADGNGLLATFWIGDGTMTSLTVYDAAAKQVRYIEAHSGGAVWDVVCFKKDGEWRTRGVGTNPDGTKATSEMKIKVVEEGAIAVTGAIKGPDGKVNNVNVVYRHVGK